MFYCSQLYDYSASFLSILLLIEMLGFLLMRNKVVMIVLIHVFWYSHVYNFIRLFSRNGDTRSENMCSLVLLGTTNQVFKAVIQKYMRIPVVLQSMPIVGLLFLSFLFFSWLMRKIINEYIFYVYRQFRFFCKVLVQFFVSFFKIN